MKMLLSIFHYFLSLKEDEKPSAVMSAVYMPLRGLMRSFRCSEHHYV